MGEPNLRKLRLEELARPSAEAYKSTKKRPAALVLDNVRSLHNVGAAFRTADAFGIERVVLVGITGTPPHREIFKTALGAENTVDWVHFPAAAEAADYLKQEGYDLIALEQTTGSGNLLAFQPAADQKYAFVFGNEVDGVSDELLARCDQAVEIPQFGTKHSLNVSVCFGIVLYDHLSKTQG